MRVLAVLPMGKGLRGGPPTVLFDHLVGAG
jgi:hypothetical protein